MINSSKGPRCQSSSSGEELLNILHECPWAINRIFARKCIVLKCITRIIFERVNRKYFISNRFLRPIIFFADRPFLEIIFKDRGHNEQHLLYMYLFQGYSLS